MTLTAVQGIRVGHAQLPGAGSGCTAVLGPFRGAVEVTGMATGTREIGVLSPHHLVDRVDAILLTGGSAFGLAAADGVMEWLSEQGFGFDTGVRPVPLVPTAVLFDLTPGGGTPGPLEGREAAASASDGPVSEGRIGAGSGATVGKLAGAQWASPGGVGSASAGVGGGVVGALAVVNALGDVVDGEGTILAGARDPESGFRDSDELAREWTGTQQGFPGTNTTLAVVATDLPLGRLELGRLAKMASTALPRAISPVGTPFDGDVVFAVSTSPAEASISPRDLLALGVTAREVLEESIRRAVRREGDDEAHRPTPGGEAT
ncbi:MAG: P1 family peptidase [Gemmatimonadetes bacterium]|nr:P1 family peptidase [Gemmatimonadota bacterium]